MSESDYIDVLYQLDIYTGYVSIYAFLSLVMLSLKWFLLFRNYRPPLSPPKEGRTGLSES